MNNATACIDMPFHKCMTGKFWESETDIVPHEISTDFFRVKEIFHQGFL